MQVVVVVVVVFVQSCGQVEANLAVAEFEKSNPMQPLLGLVAA